MRVSFSLVAAALLIGAMVVGCGSDGGGGDGGGGDWQNQGGRGGAGGRGGSGGTGGTGSPGGNCTPSSKPGQVQWSCDLGSFCINYIGSTFESGADFEKICESTMEGAYSSGPCDTSVYSGGGCLQECGSDAEAMHYFLPDELFGTIAKEACDESEGTWID